MYGCCFNTHTEFLVILYNSNQFSSVTQLCPTLCDPMDCTRPSCPSPAPEACSNSHPLSWWCHPTISSSVIPFSSCLQSFPVSGSFPLYTGVVCHSFLQWITFCQNSPPWPVRMGWPYMPWLVASLSYTSSFTTIRQWPMKKKRYNPP